MLLLIIWSLVYCLVNMVHFYVVFSQIKRSFLRKRLLTFLCKQICIVYEDLLQLLARCDGADTLFTVVLKQGLHIRQRNLDFRTFCCSNFHFLQIATKFLRVSVEFASVTNSFLRPPAGFSETRRRKIVAFTTSNNVGLQ